MFAVMLTSRVHAQASQPSTAPAAATQAATAPADVPGVMPLHPPLLREGSLLVEAAGSLQRDPASGWWVLVVRPDDPGFTGAFAGQEIPEYHLIMLPSTTLQEMQRVLETSPGQNLAFEVSGQVTVFRGCNYMLATHAGRMTHREPAATMPTTALSAPATSPATMPAAASQPHVSAENLAGSLERSISTVPRHIESDSGVTAGPSSLSSDSVSANRLGFNVEAGAAPPSAHGEKTLREGTAVQSRRGKLTRDAAGAWMFVFDADSTGGESGTGGADPPVRLLPCLLLEKIEDYARRNPSTSPVLITGEIYLYNGRNYLLPTVYRVPQERTKIAP